MLTQNLYQISADFLKKPPQKRLLVLNEIGLARYASFLTIMPLAEANIACTMRFFINPSKAKFPNLQGADLASLVLDGVNFIRADLSKANLSNSSLVDADLIFANFTNANLSNANLQGATLNETIWQELKKIPNSQSEKAKLGNLQGKNGTFRDNSAPLPPYKYFPKRLSR